MKYINYSLEDFLADPKFKEWILNPNPDSDYYWKSFLQQFPEKKNDILKAKKIISGLRFPEPGEVRKYSDEELELMLEEVLKSPGIHENPMRDKVTTTYSLWNRTNWTFRAAAVLIVAMATAVLWGNTQNSVPLPGNDQVAHVVKKAKNGQKLAIVLEDGTRVKLNSGSEISYPEHFDSVRTLRLQGEAFFEVSKNEMHPFHVVTGDLTTIVLGTKFGVRFYPGENKTEVALIEGKVNVVKGRATGYSISHILSPTEKISYSNDRDEFSKSKFDYESSFGWKDDILVFKNNSFQEVIEKLEKWYGVEFIINKHMLSKKDFSARYEDELLENVLRGLSYTFKFNYRIDEKTIIIN